MSFVYYDTKNGKAFFEQTDQGLRAVADPSIVKKLQSGALTATPTSVAKTTSFSKPAPTLPDLKTTNSDYGLPSTKPGDMTMFANALNKAVEMGRATRNDSNLDFLDGVVKPGAVSASSFTSLLGNLNTAFSKESQSLTDAAMKQLELQNTSLEDDRKNMQELALKMIENGASSEQVKLMMASGSMEAALPVAATALKDKMKDAQIFSTSKGLVAVTTDENGNQVAKVIFSTPGSGTGSDIFKSGGGETSDSSIGEMATKLEQLRGDDGHTNTQAYVDAYNTWIDNHMLASDFFKKFDPDHFLNPNDPTIPVPIKDAMKKNSTDSFDSL